jgi:hypothetical protein
VPSDSSAYLDSACAIPEWPAVAAGLNAGVRI